jgi:hypothetical protein
MAVIRHRANKNNRPKNRIRKLDFYTVTHEKGNKEKLLALPSSQERADRILLKYKNGRRLAPNEVIVVQKSVKLVERVQ